MKRKTRNADKEKKDSLRRGWTTGACATAATKAALKALLTNAFDDPITITLPKGETPSFALAHERRGEGFAEAGIIKDAGDDPDVTHGALVISRVSKGAPGSGVTFKAGEGVGTVTKPGLPIDVGEPSINPVPRQMMSAVVETLSQEAKVPGDFVVVISIPNGKALAKKTWNPRLGIVGGLSILGTTGIVHPFSCSAWIHSIHRGIDVARAEGLTHVAGCTGSTSEATVQKHFGLPDHAMLDMGDFAGGLLKYLRNNPIDRLTIGGGFAKLTKLAQGSLDLHSGRSQVDFSWFAACAKEAGKAEIAEALEKANTAQHAREIGLAAGFDLAPLVARQAREKALSVMKGVDVALDVMVVAKQGHILAHHGAQGDG